MDTLGFSGENITAVVTGSGVQFTGLLPGVTYSINVISVASGGKQTPSANLNLTTSPITPTGIVVTNITNTGFTVGWNVDPGTTSHSFQINEIEVIPSAETLTYAIISTLNANTLYTLRVSAVNAGGSTPAANTIQVRTAPAPASNFSSTITTTTIVVRWSGSEGAVSFTYSMNGAPVIPSSSQTAVAPFSATFSGLTPDTPYTFIVTGRGSGGATTDSQTYAIATDGPPKQLSSNNIRQTTFGLAWKGSIDSATYTYLINGNPPSFYSMNVATVGRTAAFSGASPNTTYSIVVVKSTPTPPLSSTPITLTTLPLPPTAPVVTSSVTTTSITLTWTGSPTATSFSYSINGSTVIPATTGYQTATFTGLQPFTTYSSVRVIATNAGGSTPSTPLFITTLPLPPVAPVLSYNNLTNQGFTVLWQSITGASSYSYTINGIAATPDIYSPTSATFGSLSGNTIYTVLVTATNVTGSTSSSPLVVTTLMDPPLPPTNLLATVVGSTRLTIAWTVGAGTTSYIYTLNGSRYTPFSTTVNSATFTGLITNQLYNVIITSVNNGGTADSEYLEATTNRPTPEVPVLVIGEITQTDFIVSWQPNSGATSYAYTVDGIPNSVVTVLAENSIYLSGFLPNTIHTLIVTSTNNSGRFVSSATLSVTTLRSLPSAFTVLPGTITSNSISVTWIPITGVTGYTFQIDGIDVTPTSSNYSSNATFGSLNSNQGYNITVIATNNGGSTPSSISITTNMTPPTAPTALASNSITSTSFAITWTPGTGATSYSYTLNGIPTTPLLSNTSSATFHNLASNANYNVIVIATNNGGSAPSAALPVVTLLAPPSPFSITSSSITSSSFIISWTPSTATSYTYTLNGQSATPTPITASSVSFTGLIANSAYNVIVTATNNSGILVPSSPTLTVTTLMIAPTAATNLQFAPITSSGFTVSWTAGLRVTSYTYTLNGSLATPSSSTATSATFTALAANTSYNVIVISTNNGGSIASTAASVTTNMAPPSAPVLVAGTITNTSITASWQSGTGATSYSYTLGGSPATPASTTATSATFNGLTPDTSYNLIVTAMNNSGVPAASNPLSIRTRLNAPLAPVITSSAVTSNGFLISWQTGTGATSYSYTLNGSSVTPSSTTATSATFTALGSNTLYSVIVTAINNGGSAASNTLPVTTNMGPPSAPNLSQGAVTETQFTVNWQVGTGATSYAYTLNSNTVVPSSTTTTSATFTGLTANTSYSVVVTAINNSGAPAPSSPLSVTTLRTAPTAPVISSSAITSSGFTVSWSADANVTSYTYRIGSGSEIPVSGTSVNLTGLSANTQYQVVLTAINNGGSTASNTLATTTLRTAPTAPVISSSVITSSGFTVSWSADANVASYTYRIDSGSEISVTGTSVNLTGLSANTSYQVVLTATNNGGSTASNTLSTTTLRTAPTAPVITSSAITLTSFVVNWQNDTNVTSYIYTLNGVSATPSSSTTTSATFTSLSSSTTYDVVVIARNNGGDTNSNTLPVRTLTPPYSSPVSVTINNANFQSTLSMTLDSAGNVYFAPDLAYLHKIDTGGNGSQFGYIPAVAQQFAHYAGVTFANTYLYIIDNYVNGFWKLDTGGSLVTQYKTDLLKGCWNSCADGSGNLYALNGNVTNLHPGTTVGVRKLDLAGNVTTVVSDGMLAPLNNGSGLGRSQFLTIDSSGSIYISDQGNNSIVKVTNGVASTFATAVGLGVTSVGEIGIDSYGNLFIVAGTKILFINKTTAQIVYTYTDLNGHFILNACVDSAGTIWFYSKTPQGGTAFLKKLFKT